MTLTGGLLLSLAWASFTGSFSALNLVLGFLLGYGALALLGGKRRPRVRRLRAACGLAVFAVWELLLANLRVAWYTISDLRRLTPMVLGVSLRDDLTDLEITMLATLVTLTPGTLTLDLSEDRRTLFVHFMHVDDPQEAMRSITEGYERRIVEVTR